MGDFLFVDLWSDVVCPFCYLGTRQLFLAINQFEHRGHVVVRHRAFELDPGSRTDINLPLDELLARKYSMPIERARALNQRVEDEAATLGMTWSLATARPTNTFDAHRLIAFASGQGLGDLMNERLFRAYFSEGELVSDHETLSRLATEVEVEGADELWSGDTLADAVRQDESAAQELGITGVPAFLVDNKFMVVGAQGADKILEVLRRAWARRNDHSSGSAGTNAAVATE
ncbi:MAG TPA: DsbA family oxidoreductase [Acidimicrobiales bacterium]|nr:DsbA family oxidoreductase [Acidimicrobiales bacterium]